jgi:hypothetical protein
MGPGFIFKNWAHEVSLPWGVPVIKVYIYIYIYIRMLIFSIYLI